MTREKWISIGVDRALVDHIDTAVSSLKTFGKPEYASRQAFVAQAVQDLLYKERERMQAQAQAQVQTQVQKEKEREIVAR